MILNCYPVTVHTQHSAVPIRHAKVALRSWGGLTLHEVRVIRLDQKTWYCSGVLVSVICFTTLDLSFETIKRCFFCMLLMLASDKFPQTVPHRS